MSHQPWGNTVSWLTSWTLHTWPSTCLPHRVGLPEVPVVRACVLVITLYYVLCSCVSLFYQRWGSRGQGAGSDSSR